MKKNNIIRIIFLILGLILLLISLSGLLLSDIFGWEDYMFIFIIAFPIGFSFLLFYIGFGNKRIQKIKSGTGTIGLVGWGEAYIPAEIETEYKRDYELIKGQKNMGQNYKTISYRSTNAGRIILIIILIIVVLYLAVIIAGTFKIQPIYDNLQQLILTSGNVIQFKEKTFFGHMEAMLKNPLQAWYYIFSEKEVIYMELLIEFSDAAGIDASVLKSTLIYHDLFN